MVVPRTMVASPVLVEAGVIAEFMHMAETAAIAI